MANHQSLWPSLPRSTTPTPERLLRLQAEELSRQTSGVLQGGVEVGSQGEWVTISFSIVAPRLDGYVYRLFKVRHKLPDPFNPLEFILGSKDVRRVTSQERFEDELAKILGSDATKAVLTQLLSLSEENPQLVAD